MLAQFQAWIYTIIHLLLLMVSSWRSKIATTSYHSIPRPRLSFIKHISLELFRELIKLKFSAFLTLHISLPFL